MKKQLKNLKQEKGLTMNKMNIKAKAYITYFENEQLRQLKEQQEKQIKKDLFIVDLINFIGLLVVLFFTYWIIIRI